MSDSENGCLMYLGAGGSETGRRSFGMMMVSERKDVFLQEVWSIVGFADLLFGFAFNYPENLFSSNVFREKF